MIKRNISKTKKFYKSKDYVYKPSAEANICLTCKETKCNGNCDRWKEGVKELKGKR